MYRDDYYDGYYDDYNDRYVYDYDPDDELYHFGVKGMKWGIRRYQNRDGSPTAAGRGRYGSRNGVNWKKVGRTAAKVAGVAALAGGTALAIKNREAIVNAGRRAYNTFRSTRGTGNGALGVRGMNNGRFTGYKTGFKSKFNNFRQSARNFRNAAPGWARNAGAGFKEGAKNTWSRTKNFASSAKSRWQGTHGTGNGSLVVRSMNNGKQTGFKRPGAAGRAFNSARNAYTNWRDTGTTRLGNTFVSNRILVNNAKRYGKYGAAALGAGAGLGTAAAGAQRVRNRRNRRRG